MALSPAFLDELRSRTLLSGLISRTVKLIRAGREFKANCPFHNEKSPSFYVNDDKGFYHCFGCSQHGDAISWLTEKQGLPFMDAVKELADAAGMEVPAGDPRAAERAQVADTLYDVMAAAAEWYAAQLNGPEGMAARAYLSGRGIVEDTQRTFMLGFAPERGSKLRSALSRFGDAKLIEVGLLGQPDDGRESYDRFRNRVMIPVRDRRGRVIAFGGRILGVGEPKYYNSPETPLFDKGRTLFNLDRASAASREAGRLVVVEGNFDVISLDQAGLREVVAPLGTAVTEEQLQLMWRLVDVPTLSFDGDDAGRNAAVRVAKRALPILVPPKSLSFATLPRGEDPDSLLLSGGRAAFEEVVSQAEPLGTYLYESEVALAGERVLKPEGRADLRVNLEKLSDLCTDRILRGEYRRFFTSSFLEDFGWTKNQRQALRRSILDSGPKGNINLLSLYTRSALYGVSIFPIVAGRELESLQRMRVDHPRLAQWREDVVVAVEQRPGLRDDAVMSIIEADRPSELEARDLQVDLRFPHMRVAADPDAAVESLRGLLHFLADEQYLLGEMEAVEREVAADTTLTRYEMLEKTRQSLRERRMALNEQGYRLGTGGDQDDGIAYG